MLKSVLLNRFTLTLGAIFGAAVIWNIYVAFNNDGLVMGRVVDQMGNPVADASVSASKKTLSISKSIGLTTTDKDGRFTFEGLDEYSIVLTAKLEKRVSDSRNIRLWFKKQNTLVKSAMVLPD